MKRARVGLYLHDGFLTVAALIGRDRLEVFTLDATEQPGVRLRAELDAHGLRSRRVPVGLPRALATVKVIGLPRVRGERLDQMVSFEIERHVPFPPEDAAFAFTELPTQAERPRRTLIVACERRVVERALRLLEEARLRPGSLTVACHELPVLLRRKLLAHRVAWVHRVGEATELVFLAGGRVRLSRSLPALGADELAQEVRDTVRLLHWRNCEAIWVSGDGEGDLVSALALAEVAPLSAPPWSRAARTAIETLPDEGYGAGVLAFAVAAAAQPRPLELLPPAMRPRRLSQAQLVTAANAALLVLLGLGVLFAQGWKEQRYLHRVSEAIRVLEPQVRAAEQLSADLTRKRRLLAAVQALEEGAVPPLPLLRELAEVLPPDAWLNALIVDGRRVELAGQAAAATQLIPLLENSPLLERVELAAPVTRAGTKEQFRIRASWERPLTAPAAVPAVPARPAPSPVSPGGRSPSG